MIIGADQDPYFRALDLDLTEKPEPEGELWGIDAGTALPEALNQRPYVMRWPMTTPAFESRTIISSPIFL